MKSFMTYLRESPNETESVVPISVYLPRRPLLGYQPRIPAILEAVKNGALIPTRDILAVNTFFPTQDTVSQQKVMAYQINDLAYEKCPLILLDDQFGPIILDGHHRICSVASVDPVALLDVDVLTTAQLQALNL